MWEPGNFLIAMPDGPETRSGYLYRGLGLRLIIQQSPKGRRKAIWNLTHLGSGHEICRLRGDVKAVFPVATEIADLTDWTFDGLYGWKNTDPELGDKLIALIDGRPKVCESRTKSSTMDRQRSEEVAREIVIARA